MKVRSWKICIIALGWVCPVTLLAQDAPPDASAKTPVNPIAQKMAAVQKEAQKRIESAAAKPTPRSADGHPDLAGFWGPAVNFEDVILPEAKLDLTGKVPVFKYGEGDELKNDATGPKARWADKSSRPVYKPGLEKKQEENFFRADFLDPSYRCRPDGVPRIGAPTEIIQTPKTMFFLYQGSQGLGNIYRVIPTNGRQRHPKAEAFSMGDSVGHWEGDTLIVDVVNFSRDTWLDRDGSWHDENMHVIERITRKGDTLIYSQRIEDPTLFAAPFEPKPTTLVLGAAAKHAAEAYPCEEKDQGHMTTTERH